MHAVGDSRHPLYYLIFSSCLNVVLDVAFIKFLGMDVGGAALATIISQFISAILCLYRLFRTHDVYRLEMKSMKIDPQIMKLIFRYGIPASFQNAITALANTMVQANINAFGEMAMAGVGAFSKIEGFLFQPVISLSMALSTFTSQNLGAKKPERAKKGAKYGTITAMCIAQAMALLFMVFAEPFLGFFTPEPEAIAFGMQRLMVVGWFYFALAATHCLAGVMRGAGKAMTAMIAYAGFWCVLRVALLAVLVPVFETINAVFSVFSITWCCSMIYLMIATFRGKWLTDYDK